MICISSYRNLVDFKTPFYHFNGYKIFTNFDHFLMYSKDLKIIKLTNKALKNYIKVCQYRNMFY